MEREEQTPGDVELAELVVREFAIRAVQKETRSIDVIASTDAVDSYGDVIEQSWRLERYKSNPVVLWAHDRWSELPIGHCTSVGVEEGTGLVATLQFVTAEACPKAEQVWQSILQKSLRAVSVGFRPATVRYEKRDDKDVYVLADNELYEISMVPIPANPDTLMRMRSLAFRSATPTPVPSPSGEPAPTHEDNSMKYLPLAAKMGIAAANEESAEAAILALAEEAAQTRAVIGTKSAADTAARLAELATASAELPKAIAERDALRADKEIRETTERAAHIDALISANPTLKAARPALESFAKADFAAFAKQYPRPTNDARERSLTNRVTPEGGETPPSSVIVRTRSHSEQAYERAQEMMKADPTKYAGDDGLERAMKDASREIAQKDSPSGRR
jgi:HK97 family phage prohead protease